MSLFWVALVELPSYVLKVPIACDAALEELACADWFLFSNIIVSEWASVND